jgi:RNA recognition motif-containing protein
MKNLFIGNLSFQTTESELRTLFEPFGQITRVHVAMDRETGRARGFAFVEMADDTAAAQAITALNGKEIGGRALRVNEAVPKGDRPSRPSSGFAPRGAGNGGGNRDGNSTRGSNSGRGGNGGRGGSRERFSNEDYRESARQPREPRW